MSRILETQNLSIGYEVPLLSELSFEVNRGECIAVMGVNGCGKSTLLKTIAGIIPVMEGNVFINSEDISQISLDKFSKLASVVLTQQNSLKGIRVLELVKLGRTPYLNLFGSFRKKDWNAVNQAMELLGIENLQNNFFENLSDGQKQKVMIARALAQETPLLILDEPTTFLDIGYRIELMNLMNKIAKEKNIGVIYSSHDWNLVLTINRFLWLITTEGRLIKGMPEDLLLEGHIQKSLGGDSFQFDMRNGQFRCDYSHQQSITIIDTDLIRKHWVEQALAKNGFFSVENSEVTVIAISGGWELCFAGEKKLAKTLLELVLFLDIWALSKL